MKPTSVLQQIAEDMFASMAYLFPCGPDEAPPPDGSAITVDVVFSGPSRGRLEMTLPRSVLGPMAVNMLGLDDAEPPTSDQTTDAVKEMLNVICGNLLPAIDDPRSVYNVSPPALPAAAHASAGEPTATATVCLEEGTVELRLYWDGRPAEACEVAGTATDQRP